MAGEKYDARRILKGGIVVCALIALLLAARYVASSFAWRAAFDRLGHINRTEFLLGGLTCILLFGFTRTLRWRALLGESGNGVPLYRLYLVNVVSLAVASVTPAQAGEVIKVDLLKRFGGVARWSGATSFVLERVADLIAILMFAAIGLAVHPSALPRFGGSSGNRTVLILLVGCASLILATGFVLKRVPSLRGLPRRSLVHLAGSTALVWSCVAAGWWFSADSVGVRLGLLDTVGLVGIVTLGMVLSLLPGGLGVAEAIISVVLQRIGRSAGDAQATALAVRAFALLWIPIGLMHLLAGAAILFVQRARSLSGSVAPTVE